MRRTAFVLILALVALTLSACACGPSPAVTLRSPIGVGFESNPEPVRMTPGWARPTWSAPRASAAGWECPPANPRPAAGQPCQP